MDIMPTNHVNDSRVVESVHILEDSTSVNNPILKFCTPILAENVPL